jgi:pre-rRNA-processing protein TSR1
MEPGDHVFVTGLLPHEQCLSVLNIVLNRTNDSEIILKSKERLIFHVGFRRFASAPIYSQHTNGDKHKVYFILFDYSFFISLNDIFVHVKH